MTEQPRTFTAPVTGRYHVSTGSEPHLVEDCNEKCQPGAVFSAVAGSAVQFMNSGAAVEMPMNTVAIAFNHD